MRGKGIIYLMEITYVGAMPGKLLQCLKQVFLQWPLYSLTGIYKICAVVGHLV
jgi:ATP-dependent Lon protease